MLNFGYEQLQPNHPKASQKRLVEYFRLLESTLLQLTFCRGKRQDPDLEFHIPQTIRKIINSINDGVVHKNSQTPNVSYFPILPSQATKSPIRTFQQRTIYHAVVVFPYLETSTAKLFTMLQSFYNYGNDITTARQVGGKPVFRLPLGYCR